MSDQTEWTQANLVPSELAKPLTERTHVQAKRVTKRTSKRLASQPEVQTRTMTPDELAAHLASVQERSNLRRLAEQASKVHGSPPATGMQPARVRVAAASQARELLTKAGVSVVTGDKPVKRSKSTSKLAPLPDASGNFVELPAFAVSSGGQPRASQPKPFPSEARVQNGLQTDVRRVTRDSGQHGSPAMTWRRAAASRDVPASRPGLPTAARPADTRTLALVASDASQRLANQAQTEHAREVARPVSEPIARLFELDDRARAALTEENTGKLAKRQKVLLWRVRLGI